jgi:hypothetical protein
VAETRKLAAILAADVAGYSRLTGADEEGTLARLRALRNDLIDPPILPTPHTESVATQRASTRPIAVLTSRTIAPTAAIQTH